MKIVISGKITGLPREEVVEKFAKAQAELEALGYTVLNPTILPPEGFKHSDYMHICKAMIDVCEVVFILQDWMASKGAKMENSYAIQAGKQMMYYPDLVRVQMANARQRTVTHGGLK